MNPGLNKLVKNLADVDFKYLIEEFCPKYLELSKQKGAYPYEYMDSFKKINEKKLPDRRCFYRSLKNGKTGDDNEELDGYISHEEYLTREKIWDVLGMNNMGDYHNHYFKKDVLLLADVFKRFIDTSLKFYGRDPCNYFSSLALSWDAMLKMAGAKLEKTSDIAKYLLIEEGLRGEISLIAKKYAEANNKSMKDYDPKKRQNL